MKNLFKIDIQDKPLVIAGPCSAESEIQMLTTARALKSVGVKIFRAGVWKPRTKPGGFEGIGSEALKWLSKVKQETGMLTATEVANARHVHDAVGSGVDILWIGARTSANPFAVQEISDALKEFPQGVRDELTILVKNPVNPDLELWIGAIERIKTAGIERIGAIHRGFTSYGRHIYRNPPEWRIPIELKRRMPELPVICDPSHIGGKRELIGQLSQQALDMNFNGLIIESHCSPEMALSDKDQQVTPGELGEIIETLIIRDKNVTTESLDELRRRLDAIDNDILNLLAKRMDVAREIGQYKREHSMPVVQPARYKDLIKNRVKM
ncbi:MAG: bifunctional 3-deoxy-7-phosphoheptulonate synthase/chorismate mutase type II, partial [Muribaculaceae bacterium]|nr:bifunctional 3-deoxy-7-phosphoheptulonate synthase/chorismate mutase type II [Muribaculaceae bacterium]